MSTEFLNNLKDFNSIQVHAYFESFCSRGDVESITQMLESPKLPHHIDLYIRTEGLRQACRNGHLNVVKCLTNTDKWYFVPPDSCDGICFQYACHEKRMEIIEYFLFDLKIEKSEALSRFFKEFSNEVVENMFLVRDNYNNLKTELDSSTSISSQKKKTNKV